MLQHELNLIDDFPPQDDDAFRGALRQSLGADADPDQLGSATEDDLRIRALHTLADITSREATPGQLTRADAWRTRPPEPEARSWPAQLTAAARLWEQPQATALGLDPLAALATTGELPGSLGSTLDQLAAFAGKCHQARPGVRAVRAGSRPYHLAGSTACQDIAFALSTALAYLGQLETGGLELRDAARQLECSFHLDCRFFEATAMLRAARLLWRQMLVRAGLTGTDLEAAGLHLHVQTGARVLTRRDPWVNLLRNTACCLAGALAGAEAITTTPHDAAAGPPSDFARRLAGNTQLVLQQESRLSAVADPAAGSWFLESLTRRMAARAWEIVRQIEGQGGMARALQSGLVHELIEPARLARRQRLEKGEQLITGVTAFADLAEELPPPPPLSESPPTVEVTDLLARLGLPATSGEPLRIEPLPAARLAEPFENLAPAGNGGAA